MKAPDRLGAIALTVVVFVAAGVALAVVQPFQAGPVSFDGGSSVLHFERLISGQRLETFITTTPKPLLTLVYGGLYALLGDWRAISWATIGAYAVGIGLVTWLATRIGGIVAGFFAAVAFIASPTLLGEVIIASAIPWALVGWAAAGLAVTAKRPRYAVAGVSLMLATLARVETLVILGVAAAVLGGLWLHGRLSPQPRVPRGAWWILLGFVALPVMLVHDWLLTGDPLFWASVATRYSDNVAPDRLMDPRDLTRFLFYRYLPLLGIDVLAIIGIFVARRTWPLWIGLAALGPGMVAFLYVLSVRGTFITPRYAVPIDVALLFTAALGASGLVGWLSEQAGRRGVGTTRSRLVGGTMLAGVAAVALGWPPAPLDPVTHATAAAALALAEDEHRVVPVLQAAIATIPDARAVTPVNGRRVVVIVPVALRTLLAADLDLPLTRVESTGPSLLAPAKGLLATTDLAYHDRGGDPRSPAYAELEVAGPTTITGQQLTPLLVDVEAGIWVYAVTGP